MEDSSGFRFTRTDHLAIAIFALLISLSLGIGFLGAEVAALLGIADDGKEVMRSPWPSTLGRRIVWLCGRTAKASFWAMLPLFLYLVFRLAWHKVRGE
jgi:hypothetical protein